MKNGKSRSDHKLPVTAEVGGEGGSYADAAIQAETFSGPEGNPRADAALLGDVDGDRLAEASEGEQVLEDGPVMKHATEPPEPKNP